MSEQPESQSPEQLLRHKAKTKLERAVEVAQVWVHLKNNQDFKLVVLETYLGDLEGMKQQLVNLLEQSPDEHFEELRLKYVAKKSLKRFLDSIDSDAKTAHEYLEQYKDSLPDQTEIDQDDDWQ